MLWYAKFAVSLECDYREILQDSPAIANIQQSIALRFFKPVRVAAATVAATRVAPVRLPIVHHGTAVVCALRDISAVKEAPSWDSTKRQPHQAAKSWTAKENVCENAPFPVEIRDSILSKSPTAIVEVSEDSSFM